MSIDVAHSPYPSLGNDVRIRLIFCLFQAAFEACRSKRGTDRSKDTSDHSQYQLRGCATSVRGPKHSTSGNAVTFFSPDIDYGT